MFANRYTAVVDACSLASALKRNLLLSLAEAEFFRIRWSEVILDETERAIASIQASRGVVDAGVRAARARRAMQNAFEDATVDDFEALIPLCGALPDPGDAHVLAAALKTQAAMIVTENLRHFPPAILAPLNIEAKSADAFIADTLSLNLPRGVEAIRTMRARFKRPELTADELLLKMDAEGLAETVSELRNYIQLI